ncbi:tumor necrosis factor receptor superfamily member 10B isoform 2-T2 [Acridotheres tristis]
MRRSRRRRLPVLLLLTMATLVTGAVVQRRDSSDLLNPGWGGRDGCYKNGAGLSCQKCPAGTYLAEECKEQNSSSKCEPCGDGEYMEYPNAFSSCQECSKCREDQVQLSPCQPTRNTVCACKDGTFCPPEHPCEMCQKCQPRCPEGQVMLKPCTPDSDLQCGPAMDSSTFGIGATIGVIVGIIVLILIGFCVWKLCCSSSGDGRSSSKGLRWVRSMFEKLPWCKSVNVESRDNNTNEERDPEAQPWVTPPPPPSVRPKRPRSERREWNLFPAPGDEPGQRLRSSYYIFAKAIRKDNWKKFGRCLKLDENDIVMTEMDDDFYEMLLRWQSREGYKASVNTLLQTLDDLCLSDAAERVSSILLQRGLFQVGAEGNSEQAAPPSPSYSH